MIYIGNVHKVVDLIEFWNLRAAGENIFFLPIKDYKTYENQIKNFVSDHLLESQNQVNSLNLQYSPSMLKERFNEINEFCNWIKEITKINPSIRTWLANWGITRKRVSDDISCVRVYNKREETYVVYTKEDIEPFHLLQPGFITDNFPSNNRYLWADELSFIGFYDNNYTIDLPNQGGMQEIAQYDLVPEGKDVVRINEQGLVTYVGYFHNNIHIQPVNVYKVISKLFEKVGYTITPSSPGIFANKILQTMGGIDSCRVFKIKGVREVLKELNTGNGYVTTYNKHTKKARRIYGKIPKTKPLTANRIKEVIKDEVENKHNSKNWINELYEDIVLSYQQQPPLTPDIVLDCLISKKLISPGLKLKCKECSKKRWYKLGSFTDTFKCVYCNMIQNVPRIEKQEWFYKTEGMLSIADEGQGSLPVILALWRLNHSSYFGNGKFITSHDIKGINNDFKSEIDFVYYTLGNNTPPMELVLGEARNYTEFKSKDINKSLTIAKKFLNKPFLAYVTLKDSFSNKEKEHLKKIMKKGYFILPFTRFEVDAYDLYKRFDKLFSKYALTLEELSINLCQVNLDMKQDEIYDMVEAEQRIKIKKM